MFKLRCARARKIRRQGGEIRLFCPPTSVFPREKKKTGQLITYYMFFFLPCFSFGIFVPDLFIYFVCLRLFVLLPSGFSFINFFTLFYRNSSLDKFRTLGGAAPYSMTLALMDALGRRMNINECLVCALAAAGSRSLITVILLF